MGTPNLYNNTNKVDLLKNKYLLLFGLVGVGKSSFIQCFPKGKIYNKGNNKNFSSFEIIREGFNLHFIEINDDSNDENIKGEFIRKSYPLINIIFLVLRFYDIRVSHFLLQNLKLLMKFYPSKDFWEHVIIVRTFSERSKKFYMNKAKIEGKLLEYILDDKEINEIMTLNNIDKPSYIKEYFVDCDEDDLDEDDLDEETLEEFEAIFQQVKNSYPICKEKKEELTMNITEEKEGNSTIIHISKIKRIQITDFDEKIFTKKIKLKEEKYNLKGEIVYETLEEKFNFIKNGQELKKDLDKLKSKNQILENENAELKKQIEEKELVKKKLEKESKEYMIEEIINKDKEIKELKEKLSRFPFVLEEGEKYISIIIMSLDEKILYSMICKNTDVFSKIENKLYKKYPEYSENENAFYLKRKKIEKNKSLSYNGIKDNDIIILNKNNNI